MHFWTDLGHWGVVLALLVEVIPSELALAYGGYLVAQGQYSFWEMVFWGTVAGVVAQLMLYALGRFGGRAVCERYGAFLMLPPRRVAVVERWFDRHGVAVVLIARLIPVVRHAVSIPAGIVRMPFWTFCSLTTVAIFPWTMGFVWLGQRLGVQWYLVKETIGPYSPFLLGAFGLFLCVWWHRTHKKNPRKMRGELELIQETRKGK